MNLHMETGNVQERKRVYETKKEKCFGEEKATDSVWNSGSADCRGSGCRPDAKRAGLCGGEDIGREYHWFLRAESWR